MKQKDFRKELGQLLMMGVAQPELSREEEKVISEIQPAGVIYFRRNVESPKQLAKLSHAIYKLTDELPLIGIDQEGGWVARLDAPFTVFPGNETLGRAFLQTKKDDLTVKQATAMAKELRTIGVNINFTPLADVASNPSNPIVPAKRAFGTEPKIVSKLVSKTVHAYRKQKVISCAKHFPGHGDTNTDSHLVLPFVDVTKNTLMKREIPPFQAAIRAQVPTIMTAHVVYNKIDKLPATLSKKILEDLLRKKLKFKGVIISDDMEMSAIAGNMDIPQASVEAIAAGVDMLLVCKKLDLAVEVYEAIVRAVETGKLSSRRVVQSLDRIAKMKKLYLKKSDFEKLPKQKNFNWPTHRKLSEKIKKFEVLK
jgi:beta-N-acetylhexosaminidase